MVSVGMLFCWLFQSDLVLAPTLGNRELNYYAPHYRILCVELSVNDKAIACLERELLKATALTRPPIANICKFSPTNKESSYKLNTSICKPSPKSTKTSKTTQFKAIMVCSMLSLK